MKFILCISLIFFAANASRVSKVTPGVQTALKETGQADILVWMTSGTESVRKSIVSTFTKSTTKSQKANALYKALNEHATTSQKAVLAALEGHSGIVKAFYINNMIHVSEADAALVDALSRHPEVGKIEENHVISTTDTVHETFEGSRIANPKAEWGIEKIQCEDVHHLTDGAGAVVGVIDSGTRGTHEALVHNYVGAARNGWFDAVLGRQDPYDDNGHGTHCTGTVVGHYGIGCAPGAQWMACKGLDAGGSGSVANLVECGQFMFCPHDWEGNNTNCDFAPDLVSNSWGGGGGQTWFDQIISNWIASDILPVFAAGEGGNCRTILSPADSRSGTIALGATDINDGLANFSPRGPSNHGQLKPDITAPGVNIRSSHHTSDTAYATMSGSSMACPHAAGLLSLIRSVENLDYADSKALIESATDRLIGFGQVCDGLHDTNDWPNNSFGHGRINATKAITKLLKKYKKY